MPGLTFSNELNQPGRGTALRIACLLYSMLSNQLTQDQSIPSSGCGTHRKGIHHGSPARGPHWHERRLMQQYIEFVADRCWESWAIPRCSAPPIHSTS